MNLPIKYHWKTCVKGESAKCEGSMAKHAKKKIQSYMPKGGDSFLSCKGILECHKMRKRAHVLNIGGLQGPNCYYGNRL